MYTVKELAELLGVSKPTVQKVINENFIEADKIEKNKYRYYTYEKAIFIIRTINPNFDFSVLPQNTEKSLKNTEKPQNKPQSLSETIAKPQNDESLDRMLTIIEQQLAQKDKEIQELREEKRDLQDKLSEAYAQISDMAKKAQYITAADKTAQIIDKQTQESAEEPAAAESAAAAVKREMDPDIANAGAGNVDNQTPEKRKGFFARLFGR